MEREKINPLNSENDTISLPTILSEVEHIIGDDKGELKILKNILSQAKDINSKSFHLRIIGSYHAEILNSLIEKGQFVNSFKKIDFNYELNFIDPKEIATIEIGKEKYFFTDDTFKFIYENEIDTVKIFAHNNYCKDNKVQILYSNYPIQFTNDEIEKYDFFSKTDFVVFIQDALSILPKNQLEIINECHRKSVPFGIFISNISRVEENEKEEIASYLLKQLKNRKISFFQFSNSDGEKRLLQEVYSRVDFYSIASEIKQRRTNYFVGKLITYLLKIRKYLIFAENEMKLKEKEFQKELLESKSITKNQEEYIKKFENLLTERKFIVQNSLKEYLKANRDKLSAHLTFEIQRSSEPKGTWERDFPFIINKEIKASSERISQILNKEMDETLKWITLKLKSAFDYDFPISNVGLLKGQLKIEYKPSEIKFTDQKKLKLQTKIGQAATVIGAGTLLLSFPIGGIVIGSSLLYQTIFDKYLNKVNEKELLVIKNELHKILEWIDINIINEYSNILDSNYSIIKSSLKDSFHAFLTTQNKLKEQDIGNKIIELKIEDITNKIQKTNKIISELI